MKYSYSEVIDCAKRLYALAHSIIFACGAFGALIGAGLGGGIATTVDRYGSGNGMWIGVCIGLIVGLLIGIEIGKTRAVYLRLLAQNALCNMEMHTAAYAPVHQSSHAPAPDPAGPPASIPAGADQAAPEASADEANNEARAREQWMRKIREQQGRCVLCGFELSGAEKRSGNLQHNNCQVFRETQADIIRYRDASIAS